MAIFKSVYIFAGGLNGWSELWYQNRSTIVDCREPAEKVALKRQLLLGKGCQLEAIRISSVEKPYKSFLFPVNPQWASESEPVADTAWNTLLGRMHSPNLTYHRVVQLRGVPDDWIIRSGVTGNFSLAASPATTPFNNFRASLAANGHLFAARSQEPPFDAFVDVTAFGKTVGGKLTATAAGVGGGPGSFVTFSDVTGFGASTYAKGRHKVTSNAAGVLTLDTSIPDDVQPIAWGVGKVRRYERTFVLVGSNELLRVSHRDTGRRFFVTRGRRSKRPASLSTPVA